VTRPRNPPLLIAATVGHNLTKSNPAIMIKIFTILFCLFNWFNLYSQTDYSKLIENWKRTANDSIFMSENNILNSKIVHYDGLRKYNIPHFSSDSAVYKTNVGDVLEPQFTDDSVIIYKVIRAEYKYICQVGIITIIKDKYKSKQLERVVNEIINNSDKIKPFDYYCKKYNCDNNQNYDCSLNSGPSDMYQKPIDLAIRKHRKGDIFREESIFGTHLIKMIANNIQMIDELDCIVIKIKK
jgi:hypothetical protein